MAIEYRDPIDGEDTEKSITTNLYKYKKRKGM